MVLIVSRFLDISNVSPKQKVWAYKLFIFNTYTMCELSNILQQKVLTSSLCLLLVIFSNLICFQKILLERAAAGIIKCLFFKTLMQNSHRLDVLIYFSNSSFVLLIQAGFWSIGAGNTSVKYSTSSATAQYRCSTFAMSWLSCYVRQNII